MGIIKLKSANTPKEEVTNTPEPENVQEQKNVRKQWDNPAILYEDESRVDEHSRHYVLNNGTAKTVVTAQASNFYDEDKKQWKGIDNTLVENGDVYENAKGKHKTQISKVGKGKSVKISNKDKSLAWDYIGKVSATGAKLATATENTTLSIKEEKNRAVYENIEKSTDIEYSVHGNGVKENIIVREKSEDYRYAFKLKTQGLKLRLSEDNASLELYSETTENNETKTKVEYTIPSPYMYDANGETTDEVYFELEGDDNDDYSFTVVASEDWINAEERAFPVTIDPQVVTSNANMILCTQYRKYISSSTETGWGVYQNESYYRVYSSTTRKDRIGVSIYKNAMNLLEHDIISVKVYFTPYLVTTTGSILANGKNITVNSTLKKLAVDITSEFRISTGTVNFYLEPTSTAVDISLYKTANAPYVEIEYLTNEKTRITKKRFDLSGGVIGEYNVATGELESSFIDVPASDSVMGLQISHHYKKSNEDFGFGKNFRLNLNERLEKYTDSVFDANYIYTDANGDKHGFKDFYYYLDTNGARQYVEKTAVSIDLDGNLTYTDTAGNVYEIKKEQRTSTGLSASTKIESFKNAELIEQRIDELKQLESQYLSYKSAVDGFVKVNLNNPELLIMVQQDDYFNLEENEVIISRNDAVSYFGLRYQQDYYDSLTGTGIVGMEKSKAKIALESSFFESRLNLSNMTISDDSEDENNRLTHSEILTQVKNKLFSTTPEYDWSFINSIPSDYQFNYKSGIIMGYDLRSVLRQHNLLLEQRATQEADFDTQYETLYNQIRAFEDNINNYNQQAQNYYKEYKNLEHQLAVYKRQLPVNYLTDGKIIKGFNEQGWLVAIYDNYDNSATIEYDENGKILRVYDGEEKQITFDYTPENRIKTITDTRGRKTEYEYNANGDLTKATFANGKHVTFYTFGNEYTTITSSDQQTVRLNYSEYRLSGITYYSNAIKIANGTTVSGTLTGDNFEFAYTTSKTTITSSNGNKEEYYINSAKNVSYYVEKFGNTLLKAEKYDFVPYEKDNVCSINKEYLYTTYYDTMETHYANGDFEKTVLNQFNNPSIKEINARVINIDATDSTKQSTSGSLTTYTYDDNQKCTKEQTVVTVTLPTETKTYTQITNYNYNSSGDVVRKETYVVGEELTNGKTIEETIYDSKGNVVKSFTYNSLDTSSKFYTESDYAENGQVLADYDETGENKTEYEYISGTNIVKGEKLPNGSKFAYGHDISDTVTAISHSTEQGEENSTQTRYTCGVVTELVSGNNKVNYEYDYKRRKTAVHLNGTNNYLTYAYTDNTTLNSVTVDKVVATNAKGEKFTSYTNKKGKLLENTYNDELLIRYTYNDNGTIKNALDKSNGYQYTYDTLDRLTQYTSIGYNETHTYDEYGAKSRIVHGGNTALTYDYTYKTDSAHTLSSMKVGLHLFAPKTDILGRNAGREIANLNDKILGEYIYYRKVGDHATNMPSAVYFGNIKNGKYAISDNIKYEYDNSGNIISITENGKFIVGYTYDKLNRLVREDNKGFGKTYIYSYDNMGNILSRRECAYTLKPEKEIEYTVEKVYTYDGDKLLSYGNELFEYDAIGNATTYRGKTVTWSCGRQMTNYDGIAMSYDGFGRRTSKGNITYTYDSNNRVIKQSNGLEFIYDNSGVAGFTYNSATYLYQKDVLGNICKIIDSVGNVVVQYKYDAWGNHTIETAEPSYLALAELNPFRYRSYYYDSETNLYYLKSRYYDPETGRFTTIDDTSYLDPDTINGLNLYAYCLNNPILYSDNLGCFPFVSIFNKIYYEKLVYGFNNKWWGRIDYSTSILIKQTNEEGFLYAFAELNLAEQKKSIGIGINAFGWIGLEITARPSGDFSIEGNLTPWFNLGVNIGLSGVSLSVSVNIAESRHSFAIGIGLAPAVIIIGVVSIILSFGQMASIVMSWFSKIF